MRNFFLLLILFLFPLSGWGQEPPVVMVTIAPHKFLVENIAKDSVRVFQLVPSGADLHSYSPKPSDIVLASQAKVWFRMGEPIENRLIEALHAHKLGGAIVDLREGLPLIGGGCPCGRADHCGETDPHIWLSLPLMSEQAKRITSTLSQLQPHHAEYYAENLRKHLLEVEEANRKISSSLAKAKNRTFLVSHPAYAYFCRDYQCEQICLEEEGKVVTPRTLTTLIQLAREKRVPVVIGQAQYNLKLAGQVAKALGISMVVIDPLQPNYIETLQELAGYIAQ